MRIINRTKGVVTIRASKEGWKWPGDENLAWDWIHPGQPYDKGMGHDTVYLSVARGRVSTLDWTKFNTDRLVDEDGPYSNTHTILIIDDGRALVDWSAAQRTYISDVRAVSTNPEQPDPQLQKGLACASAVLSACATGLAALGPVGAAPATIVQLVASMIALSNPQAEIPEPPQSDEIQAVVERIVAQQSEKNFALEATDSFLMAQQWLLDQDAQFRTEAAKASKGAEKGQGPDLVGDFYYHLENWANENGEFRKQVHRMCRTPEIAKWIIPAFLTGVGAYLQILRLHAVANRKTDRATIVQFQREVETCKRGLVAAAQAWWDHVLKRLQEHSVYGTPEGDWATSALNRAYVGADVVGPRAESPLTQGLDDRTPIGSAVYSLNEISKYLVEDLEAIDSGKPATHFYKTDWRTAAAVTS